ncbi:ABC transporter permease, partial [Enterocloster citroniae]|nr:ABC transporter permease [Enterocloster citroniae]
LILTVAILYYGFKPGDSYLIVLTPLAFLFKIPYAVPLLVGLGGSLASVIPVGCGVFLYYLIMYVKQNAGVLTNDAAVDIVQKYSQILKSVIFNQTMMVMIATCAVGIIIVYLIRRLSMDYSWIVAIAAGSVAELLVIFVGDFVFGVTVAVGQLILGILLSAVIAAVYNFFIFTVDYTRTEHVQFEDDDYYYYVKAVPKMNVSTPDVKVQKISTRKRSTRERNVY